MVFGFGGAGPAPDVGPPANQLQLASVLLVFVPASLGASNHRYTYSYVCACEAATYTKRSQDAKQRATGEAWARFREINEAWWRGGSACTKRIL